MTAHRDNTSGISDLLTAIRGKSVPPSVKIGSRTWAIKHAYEVIHTPVDKELAVFVVIRTGSKKQSWHRLKDMSSDYLDVLRAADINGASPIGTTDQINARRMIRSSLAYDCALLKRIYGAWRRSKKLKDNTPREFDFFKALKGFPTAKLHELKSAWESPIRKVVGENNSAYVEDDIYTFSNSYVEEFICNVLEAEGLYQVVPSPGTIKRSYLTRSSRERFSKRLRSDAGPTSPLELRIRKALQEGSSADLEKLLAIVLRKYS